MAFIGFSHSNSSIYTEQSWASKSIKLITSSERFAWVSLKEKMRWNRKRLVFKNGHRNECLPPCQCLDESEEIYKSRYSGYVTICHCVNFFWDRNSYNASVELLAGWAVSAIFKKLPIAISPHFSSFWANSICFQMFLSRSIKAYLCPNMIKFGEVNFLF